MLLIFSIADRLHMTVRDLMKVSASEFRGWLAYTELMKPGNKAELNDFFREQAAAREARKELLA